MQIPLVDLKSQYAAIKDEIDAAIRRVLDHTGFILGAEVERFEDSFARHTRASGAVGVASGTAALQLALEVCGIGRGDEVITTAHTFFATAEAISRSGATPVFADIEELSYNIDPNHIEHLLKSGGSRVKAIVPVHLYGHPAQMDPIWDLAERHGAWVIEDAAQAHGAEYKGQRCGSMGHLACFSFFPGKNLGAYGDGGAVTGNDPALLDKVRKLRNHGRGTKYAHDMIGFGERLDALQAAILGVKLKRLEDWTEKRRTNANTYRSALAQTDVTTPHEASNVRHVYHLFVIRTRHRDDVVANLKSKRIGVGIHYPIPLHRQPAYLDLGYGNVSLPLTEKIADEIVSLPMFPELTNDQIFRVAEAVKEVTG